MTDTTRKCTTSMSFLGPRTPANRSFGEGWSCPLLFKSADRKPTLK